MTKQYEYGTNVVEFFKYSEDELSEVTKEKETIYNIHSESPAYPELGLHVDWFSDKPLAWALNELTEWLLKGYTVTTALTRPLYLKVQLKKPQAIVESDFVELAEQAKELYDQRRYERNKAETERQVAISVQQKARQAAAAAAKAAEKHQVTEEQKALADLLKAYNKPLDMATQLQAYSQPVGLTK